MIIRAACMSAVCWGLTATWAQAAGRQDIDAGRRVAAQACGGCHAVGPGSSPLQDAPPFRLLHLRYPPGGLDRMLQEGMIGPIDPQDDAPRIFHPRMPMADLDIAQIDDLRAYLKSLEPKPGQAP